MDSRTVRSDRQPAWHLAAGAAVMLAALACTTPALAQATSAGSPSVMQAANDQGAPARRHAFDDVPATPLPWSQLDAQQQAFLAPLRNQWNQFPPHRQRHLAIRVQRWLQLPPPAQSRIQQRLARWAQMTPQQRMQAARNARAFQNMSPEDRQRVADVFHRFQSLTPEQKQALRAKFRQMRQEREAGAQPADARQAPP